MTPDEIALLLIGFGIGAQAMAIFGMVSDMRAERRSDASALRARRGAAGDRYLNSLRLYQLQHRSPR